MYCVVRSYLLTHNLYYRNQISLMRATKAKHGREPRLHEITFVAERLVSKFQSLADHEEPLTLGAPRVR